MEDIFTGKLKWASPLLLFLVVSAASARVLSVPETYSTINGAMAVSVTEDTILVGRGIYDEQLWFPSHRIYVMSRYELTGDTLDVEETIIDGITYADHDTATIALFLRDAADSSKLCGFTLQGGHGTHGQCGAFLADSSSPIICHNVITHNHTTQTPAGWFVYSEGTFRGNHILENEFLGVGLRVDYNLYWGPVHVEDNSFGHNPLSPDAGHPGIEIRQGAQAVVHGNIFRGLTGLSDLAISANYPLQLEISNNVFDSMTVRGAACALIWVAYGRSITLSDNVFSNVDLQITEDGGLVDLFADQHAFANVTIEGNVFEHISAPSGTTVVAPVVRLQDYSGAIRNNLFRDTGGSYGAAVYTISAGLETGLALEHNLFEACSTTTASEQ